jgi:hypothetical protein
VVASDVGLHPRLLRGGQRFPHSHDQGPQLVFGIRMLAQQRCQFQPPYRNQNLPNLIGISGLQHQGSMGVKLDLDSGLDGRPAVTEQAHHPKSSGLPPAGGHRCHQHRSASPRNRRPLSQQVLLLGRDTT